MYMYIIGHYRTGLCGKAWKGDFRIGVWELAKLFVKGSHQWQRLEREFVSPVLAKQINLFRL